MKKVLVVAVHLDDETLGCGGTILKHLDQGDQVYWLLVSQITTESPCNMPIENVNRTESRVKTIAESYHFNGYYQLRLAPAKLHLYETDVLISKFEQALNEIKPNVIYMPFRGDVHSDHRIVFDSLYGCTKSFRRSYIEQVYMMETLSETEFAPAIPGTSFCPNIYVDITPYLEQKLEIMSLHESEVMSEPYPRSLSSLRALARLRGSRCGVMYAESFMLLYAKY